MIQKEKSLAVAEETAETKAWRAEQPKPLPGDTLEAELASILELSSRNVDEIAVARAILSDIRHRSLLCQKLAKVGR